MQRDTILLLMMCGAAPESAVECILSAINTAKTEKLNFRVLQKEQDKNAFHLVFRRNPEMIQYYYTPDASLGDMLRLISGGMLMCHKYVALVFQGERFTRRGWGKQLLQSNKETMNVGNVVFIRHDVFAQRGVATLFTKRPLTIAIPKG